jgi:hypothetical protein
MINKRSAIIILLLITLTSALFAQYRKGDEFDPYEKDFFLTARGGVIITEDIYSFHKDTVISNLSAYFESEMTTPSNFTYGGGFGIFFTDNIGIRVDYDAFNAEYESYFELGVSNPLIPGNFFSTNTTVKGITSNWTMLSADIIFRQKLGSSIVIMAGGGLTYCMADIFVPDDFSWVLQTLLPVIVGVDYDVYEADIYTFNILATIEFFIDSDIAFTAEARYFKGEKEIDVPFYISTTPINATLGGIVLTAGIMMHF